MDDEGHLGGSRIISLNVKIYESQNIMTKEELSKLDDKWSMLSNQTDSIY